MGITYRSQDKYAFLFTGPTAVDRFIKDLENVFQVLTQYYNYPANQITVVLGSADATPTVPDANVINVNDEGELRVALDSFAFAAQGPAPGVPPPDNATTALLYFTGGGVVESSVSKLVIDGGPGTSNVDPAWLATRIAGFSQCHVNVVMQQSYCGGFQSAFGGLAVPWSFTYACSDSQDSYGDNISGSFCTQGWLSGLKLETLPAGTSDPGKYADELGSMPEGTNRLVSLQDAQEFGAQVHAALGFGALSTPGYTEGSGPQYLGLPEFLIRDGSPWWESPDIYLSHPNHPWIPAGDLYIPDSIGDLPPYDNTINVRTRNVGTHPVRAFSLGIELFKSGTGPVTDQHTACDIAPAGGILYPIDLLDIGTADDQSHVYGWNTPFYEPATHTCVKAEAKLLCGDVDFGWSIAARDFEAQRNIDEMTVVLAPGPIPWPFPMLQGFREHIFGLQNRFEIRRRFILALPEQFLDLQDDIELTWFALQEGPKSERIPLEVVMEPVPHIPFLLKAGEKRDILLNARLKPEAQIEDEVRLHFEVLAEGDWPEGAREAMVGREALPNFAAIAGFTVTLRTSGATLKGTVFGENGEPLPHARIFLRTIDDLQGAVTTTDREGRYAFENINPDVYRIWAETQDLHAKEQTAILLAGAEVKADLELVEHLPVPGKPVKVILDKIRIMNDRDPCLKGKGELTFSSVVVPDTDEARKQVARLPSTGVYHVGDRAGENEIQLGVILFEGVVKNRSLSISISGREIDIFDPDDELSRYRRVFSGDPEAWYGQYYPSDEYLDREDVGEWALWYRIVSD